MLQPPVLLADEPSSHQDAGFRDRVWEQIGRGGSRRHRLPDRDARGRGGRATRARLWRITDGPARARTHPRLDLLPDRDRIGRAFPPCGGGNERGADPARRRGAGRSRSAAVTRGARPEGDQLLPRDRRLDDDVGRLGPGALQHRPGPHRRPRRDDRPHHRAREPVRLPRAGGALRQQAERARRHRREPAASPSS